MRMVISILAVLLAIPLVSAIVKDYTIITCRDVGCSKENGICDDNGYCYYQDGTKERRSCVEVPSSCLESEGRLCYTQRDYPVCVFVTEQEITIRDKEAGVNTYKLNFQNNLQIGDKKIWSKRPEFTCNPQGENWNFPQPSENCWKVSVNFDTGYTMNNNGIVNLNEYLNLKLGISGHYDFEEGRVDTYSNNFLLDVNLDFLKLNHIEDDKYFVVKDSKDSLCFIINNGLANFNSEQAGFYIKEYVDIIGIEKPPVFKPNEIKSGDNNYCIGIDTSYYGEVEYQVYAYTTFGETMVFDDESLIFRYKVVDEGDVVDDGNINKEDDKTVISYKSPECIKDEECNDFDYKTRDMCVNNICVNEGISEKSYLPYILVGLAVLVVIFIIRKGRQ